LKVNNLLVVSLLVGSVLGGCKKVEPPSQIVKKIQDAGAGDVSNASKESIEQWFRLHRDLAKQVGQDCNRVKSTKPADWGDTTEGRVCQAAASVAVFGNEHIQTDQQKF
jgi:hypothetical protein